MAEVFRPPYTKAFPPEVKILKLGKKKGKPVALIAWPDGKREVVRTNRAGTRMVCLSKTWHIRYYLPSGERKKVKGFRDKKATEVKAAELERRAARLAAGLVDPAEEHAKRPLAEHAEDYRRYLAAKGNTADYVAKTFGRLMACLTGCRFVTIADVGPSAVLSFLADLRAAGKALKTTNEYLLAIKGFCRWLRRDRRIIFNPLDGLPRLASKGDADIQHARRDFSPEELGRILDAARQSDKSIRKLPGIDRHFLYLTACATGFRARELASLTPESFKLAGDCPTVKVQSSCTKNKKQAEQPLPLDVAGCLREYLAGKPSGLPVWPGKWQSRAFLMIQADMKRARQTWLSGFQDARQRAEAEQSDFLAYCDSQDRYADFHALRHSYITMVGKTGVSPREHQDLARHSTYALTSRYTHSKFYDLAAAVQGLPIPTSGAKSITLAATGTEGPK